jgi:phenylpropionate dioxygenase-like ring-hydroxylating dioxygenase large terminal subunit
MQGKNLPGEYGEAENSQEAAVVLVRNAWYVAAWSNEVAHELLTRRICGEPVCFYHTSAGDPVAMIDRCPHRMVPLSLGHLDGDVVQCMYQGILSVQQNRPGRTVNGRV